MPAVRIRLGERDHEEVCAGDFVMTEIDLLNAPTSAGATVRLAMTLMATGFNAWGWRLLPEWALARRGRM
jgi:hypothetical protein